MSNESVISQANPAAWLQASKTRGSVEPLGIRWDADGRGWLRCYCGQAITAKCDYKIQFGQYGWQATAFTNAATGTQSLEYVGFPAQAYSIGDFGWFQVAGYCSDCVIVTGTGTIGHSVKVASDTAITGGAAPTGNDNQFGVFKTTGSAATYDILLFPVRIDHQKP